MAMHQIVKSGSLLEWLLCLSILVLAIQLFPESVLLALSGLDVRNWSRGGLFVLNLNLLLLLIGARFGVGWWNQLSRSTREQSRKQAPLDRTSKERLDPRVGLAREQREKTRKRWRVITRGMIAGSVMCSIAAAGWEARLLFRQNVASETLVALYRDHLGRLDHCTGTVAGYFKVRSDEDIVLTHLGFFDAEEDGLQINHPVGVFELTSTNPIEGKLVAEVVVPYGISAQLEQGYRWVPLPEEVKLKAGKSYLLGANVGDGSPDPVPRWQSTSEEIVRPQWNPAFIGEEEELTRRATWTPEPWPAVPIHIDTPDDSGTTFGAANAAFQREASDVAAK